MDVICAINILVAKIISTNIELHMESLDLLFVKNVVSLKLYTCVKLVNMNVKIFIVLGKSFIVKHYYDMHIATHDEDDDSQLPYVCDICKKRFATSQFLVTHRFRHRIKTDEVKTDSESITTESQNEVNIIFVLQYNYLIMVPVRAFAIKNYNY